MCVKPAECGTQLLKWVQRKCEECFFTSLVDGRVYGGGEAGWGEAERVRNRVRSVGCLGE